MEGLDLLDLLARWDAGAGAPAHQRLARMLSNDDLDGDTLGQRNRRLITLHQALMGTPIEAHVVCPACSTGNEFTLPLDEMLRLPVPSPQERVELDGMTFRLPTLADLDAAGIEPLVVARRCSIDEVVELSEDQLVRLGDIFDAADPLAQVAITSACTECGVEVTAEVDLAEFVAAEVSRFADLLLRDIDVIARGYGWSEREIVTLPAARRARYVAMIAGHRGPRAIGKGSLA